MYVIFFPGPTSNRLETQKKLNTSTICCENTLYTLYTCKLNLKKTCHFISINIVICSLAPTGIWLKTNNNNQKITKTSLFVFKKLSEISYHAKLCFYTVSSWFLCLCSSSLRIPCVTFGALDSISFPTTRSCQSQRPACPQMAAFFRPSTRWELPCQEQTAVGVVEPATSEEIPRWKPEGKFPLFPLWNGGCAVFLQGFPLFWILVGENSPWPALIPGSIQGQDVEVNHTYKHDSVHLDEHRSRWNKRKGVEHVSCHKLCVCRRTRCESHGGHVQSKPSTSSVL